MKRKVNIESGVYRYLQESGVLDQSPDVIALARKEYWNQIKRQWKKDRLKKDKEFTVSFTPGELKLINDASAQHSMSKSRFIKLAALAYVQKKYLVPNNEAF